MFKAAVLCLLVPFVFLQGCASSQHYELRFIESETAYPTEDFGYAWICGRTPNATTVSKANAILKIALIEKTEGEFLATFRAGTNKSNCGLFFDAPVRLAEDHFQTGIYFAPRPSHGLPPKEQLPDLQRIKSLVADTCMREAVKPRELDCGFLASETGLPEIQVIRSFEFFGIARARLGNLNRPKYFIFVEGALLGASL